MPDRCFIALLSDRNTLLRERSGPRRGVGQDCGDHSYDVQIFARFDLNQRKIKRGAGADGAVEIVEEIGPWASRFNQRNQTVRLNPQRSQWPDGGGSPIPSA